MKVKFIKITPYTLNLQNFNWVLTILVKFAIHFLGLPRKIFFGVITDDKLHLEPLKNVKKKMQYSSTYSGTRFLFTEN